MASIRERCPRAEAKIHGRWIWVFMVKGFEPSGEVTKAHRRRWRKEGWGNLDDYPLGKYYEVVVDSERAPSAMPGGFHLVHGSRVRVPKEKGRGTRLLEPPLKKGRSRKGRAAPVPERRTPPARPGKKAAPRPIPSKKALPARPTRPTKVRRKSPPPRPGKKR